MKPMVAIDFLSTVGPGHLLAKTKEKENSSEPPIAPRVESMTPPHVGRHALG
jgi:hypothetical protein